MTTPNRPPLSPLAQAVVDAHYGAPAMTTPNRPPLWKVMRTAYDCSTAPNGTTDDWTERDGFAAEIRALRDWLVPEETIEDAPGRFVNGCCLEDRQRLRALLTAEADRAERGDA